MAKNKNTRYRFSPYLEELHERDNIYQLIKTMFNMHGCFEINTAKIYNIDLAILFQYKDVKLWNVETKKAEIVNGMDFLWTFLEGYNEGKQLIKPNEDIIYGSNADSYISDLHNKYYHNKIGISFEGWEYVKRVTIFSFTNKEIRDYGYYSGIVSVVDKMQIDYKKQFQKFTNCEHANKLKLNGYNFFKTAITQSYNGERFLLEDNHGIKREFTPYTFLDYTLENYLEKCDATEELNKKVLILKQAYSKILDTINQYNILGCEKILEMCKSKIDLIDSELKLSEPQQTFKEPESIASKEPKNPHKRIFVNGYSYELFERLRDEIISNKKFDYADYSFIMQKMISDNYLIETNHFKLIEFLDNNYNTTFAFKGYIQFKVSVAENKKRVYSRLNKEFKHKILSIV